MLQGSISVVNFECMDNLSVECNVSHASFKELKEKALDAGQ
jgi:hypothetical protein